jgi:hypothetical protein
VEPLTAFFLFAALLAFDLLSAVNWLPLYFRIGLPVYFLTAGSKPAHPLTAPLTAEQTARMLEATFKSRPQHPSIHFKALAPGGVALREALFENRGGFRYLPVMHSTIRLDPSRSRLTITGGINAYALFVIGYLIYRSLVDTAFIPVAILILVVLALSYAAQAGINQQIAREITRSWE